jgi:hypothetical protein
MNMKRPGILQSPLDSTPREFFCVLVFELLEALSSFNCCIQILKLVD